jgi:hypothetical protein
MNWMFPAASRITTWCLIPVPQWEHVPAFFGIEAMAVAYAVGLCSASEAAGIEKYPRISAFERPLLFGVGRISAPIPAGLADTGSPWFVSHWSI